MKNRSLEHTIRDVHEMYGLGTAKVGKESSHTDPRINPEYHSMGGKGGHGAASDTSRAKEAGSVTRKMRLKAEEVVNEAKKKEYESGPEKPEENKDSPGDASSGSSSVMKRIRAGIHGYFMGATVDPKDKQDQQAEVQRRALKAPGVRGNPEAQERLRSTFETPQVKAAADPKHDEEEIERQTTAAQENPGYAAAGTVAGIIGAGGLIKGASRTTSTAASGSTRAGAAATPKPVAPAGGAKPPAPTGTPKPTTKPGGRTPGRLARAADALTTVAGALTGGSSGRSSTPQDGVAAQHDAVVRTGIGDSSARKQSTRNPNPKPLDHILRK